MNPMLCRFYGRFVLVERGGSGNLPLTLTVVMPNMTFRDSGFREHKAFLTIARHFVDHVNTTLAPTFRTMTDGNAKEAEDFIWDLKGWHLDVGASGGATLQIEAKKEIVDLAALEQIQGRTAKLKADLKPSTAGIVSAAISVGGGQGIATAAFFTPPCAFIPLTEAKHQKPTIKRPQDFQTDLLDVTLPPAAAHKLTMTNEWGETKHIALNTKSAPTIAVSNLCNALPHEVDVDHEFAQYYYLLDTVADDRLVPKVVPAGGNEDCNRQARIRA